MSGEFEVHVGHWSDESEGSHYPIDSLARARRIGRKVAERYGSATIWEQTETGIVLREEYFG